MTDGYKALDENINVVQTETKARFEPIEKLMEELQE